MAESDKPTPPTTDDDDKILVEDLEVEEATGVKGGARRKPGRQSPLRP